jgi:hypothetical protein
VLSSSPVPEARSRIRCSAAESLPALSAGPALLSAALSARGRSAAAAPFDDAEAADRGWSGLLSLGEGFSVAADGDEGKSSAKWDIIVRDTPSGKTIQWCLGGTYVVGEDRGLLWCI